VFAILLTIPPTAYAQTIAGSAPTGRELLTDCRVALQTEDKTKDGAVCIAFIQGFNFGYGMAQLTRPLQLICVNDDVEMRAVIQRVVSYLDTINERRLRDPAAMPVNEALKDAHPCRY
jgi:hypothetical protein